MARRGRQLRCGLRAEFYSLRVRKFAICLNPFISRRQISSSNLKLETADPRRADLECRSAELKVSLSDAQSNDRGSLVTFSLAGYESHEKAAFLLVRSSNRSSRLDALSICELKSNCRIDPRIAGGIPVACRVPTSKCESVRSSRVSARESPGQGKRAAKAIRNHCNDPVDANQLDRIKDATSLTSWPVRSAQLLEQTAQVICK